MSNEDAVFEAVIDDLDWYMDQHEVNVQSALSDYDIELSPKVIKRVKEYYSQ